MASVSEDAVQVLESSQSVGERLRLARESKDFSIAEVAAQLRFTKDTILHLESQQWDKLHGRAYARGYFSSYIKFLGMPQDELLSAFNIEYKSSQSDLMQPQFNVSNNKTFPWMPVLFVLIAIVITGFAYMQWQQSQDIAQDESIEDSPWQPQAQEAQPEFDAFDASVVEPMSTEELVEQLNDESDMLSNILQPELESAAELVDPPLEMETPAETNDELGIETPPEVDEVSQNELSEKVASSESLLELYSLHDCWIEVSDADANILLYKTVKANETVALTGIAPLTVTLGSAANVTVKFNDALFDTTPFTQGGIAKFTLGIKS
ncbi:hypothetical protein A9Q79_04110 [Methylophaga sp. 42_25_T18]|nr:hypothetical protein A9Q79_04110 [Methylophaga sp. 42_25_T18]OUR89020.1 hypothetical protein A9Q92_01675 [Methylophaga sp. 42_8_T64]